MREWIDLVETPLEEVIDGSGEPMIDDIATRILLGNYSTKKNKLTKIDEIGTLHLYATEYPFAYNVVDLFLMDGDTVAGDMALSHNTKHDAFKVLSVYLRPEYRNSGLGYALYTHLLDMGYNLMSSHEHTADSQRIWAKLAREYRVTHNGEVVTDTSQFYDGERSNFIVWAK